MQAAAAVNGMILVSVNGVTVVMVRFCMSALQRKRVLNGCKFDRVECRHVTTTSCNTHTNLN